MLFSRVGRAALAIGAGAGLLATPSPAQDNNNNTSNIPDFGQSTFVSPNEDVSFGLTVPLDAGEDLLFTMRVPVGVSWGAIGLGQEHMAGSLILMIYMNSAGTNVTLSPRISRGNYEPTYYDEFKYQVLPGTGIFNQTMVFSARCTSMCRHWPGGYIDVSDPNQKAIYAVGPPGGIFSDDPRANIKYHREFGIFRIDMKRTNGPADAPFLTDESRNEGTVMGKWEQGKRDAKALVHGLFMIFAIVGLLPVGVLILRVGEWVKWHAVNQVIAMLFIMIAFAMGILSSLLYTRSRSFKSPHQIIGFIIIGFVFVQFTLGVMHHQHHKKTQQGSKYAPFHVWLGRLIIALGTFNAFLGFPFALNRHYNYFLIAIVIAVFGFSFFVVFGKDWWMRRRRRNATQGYNPEPWRQADPRGGYGAPGEYNAPSQQIGLTNMVPNPGVNREKSPAPPYSGRNRDLGSEQTPRELV